MDFFSFIGLGWVWTCSEVKARLYCMKEALEGLERGVMRLIGRNCEVRWSIWKLGQGPIPSTQKKLQGMVDHIMWHVTQLGYVGGFSKRFCFLHQNSYVGNFSKTRFFFLHQDSSDINAGHCPPMYPVTSLFRSVSYCIFWQDVVPRKLLEKFLFRDE